MRKSVVLLAVFLVFISNTQGQVKSDANIVGHVTSEGNHIPYATVSIAGSTIGVSTDETGHFMLINVPPGVYKVKAQSIGFKPSEKEVTVKAKETVEVKFDLESDLLGLEEVVISADRGEIKRVEAAAIVNTLSNKLFASTQSVTLSEGLNFSPGLRIENNCQNCGFSQVRMNGMEGHYSQILINSRPIFSGLAGVYGLELIPSNMIERVEVVRGGGSALFGGSAIAGTINIILKDPVTDSYEAGINTGLTGFGVKGIGKNAYDYSVNLNTSLISDDSKTGVSLYGFSRERTDFDANNDGFSEIVPMSNVTLGTRIFHKTGFRSKVAVDLFNIREERNGGNMQDYPLHERDLAEYVKHNIRTGAVTFEQYFRDYDMLSVFASAQGLSRDSYYGANKSLKNYGLSKDLTYNVGVQYKAVFAKSTVIGGIENTGGFLTDKKLGYPDLDNAVIAGDSIISIPHTTNLTVAKQSTGTTGIFLQYEVKIDKMKISLGGRYDNFMVKDLAKGTSIKNGKVFSPRINIMYEVVKSLQARVSYSQGYRAPQIFDEDLHIETSGSRQVISVNDPDLKQETSHSFMASLDFNRLLGTTSTGFLLEGFYTRLTDPFLNEIGLPDATGLVKYTRRNAANGATVKGINMELKLSPLEKVSFTSGFTVQSSAYDEVHQFGQRSFFRTPSNYGFFAGDYDITENLCFIVTGSYTGRMNVPYFGTLDLSGAGELHRTDTFFDMGLKITYTMDFSGTSLEWYTGLKNIFNSYQEDFDSGINRDPSYIYGPVSPRAIYLGVRIGNMLKQ